MNTGLGKTLATLRRAKKLTQKDVAAKLATFGYAVKTKTVHNWEKDVAQPKIKQFLTLCEIYGVDDPLWTFVGTQGGPLRGLNQEGRDKAADLIALLLQVVAFRSDGGETEKAAERTEHTERAQASESPESIGGQRMLRLYDIPVSAGTGNFLDSSGYEMIEPPSYVSDEADFALRVSGDSMEPLLKDGQTIWMKEEQDIKDGDIGVFVYSDDVYCKKLVVKGGVSKLKSLNPKYKDIEIKDGFGFAVVGKVIA
jgi:phage repressor protein C with HTH and peptisase S24 domain/DNA-binding XRE family transcriptional regulator